MHKKLTIISIFLLAIFILGACDGFEISIPGDTQTDTSSQIEGIRQGMGPGSGMMNRHHAQVPEEFRGLTNPIPADEESLVRGEAIYITHCATCHGDYGNGDGPGGESLDPAPAAIAHTSQMMGDAYLFWRITEGGVPFETGMIPYRDILDEQGHWDVINYVRALGSGQVQPGQHMGGMPFDQEQERTDRLEMLGEGVDEGFLTETESNIFDLVHTAMDKYLAAEGIGGMDTGPRADALTQILAEMVEVDLVTQDQAETFIDVHDRLVEAGLMQ